MTRVFAIIPAGGSGTRFGGDVKKQYHPIGEDTILNRTLKIFCDHERIDAVVCAVPMGDLAEQSKSFAHDKLMYVSGGASRAHSVKNAFDALLNAESGDVVLVHDAVRCLVSGQLINRVIDGVLAHGTALPVTAVTDTMKRVADGKVVETISRQVLRAAQTPQGALYNLLFDSYSKVGDFLEACTDESLLLEKAGVPVFLVDGERGNLKITTPVDLELAQSILSKR